MSSNIANIFHQAADKWPERIAITDKDGTAYTFSQLQHLVVAQAALYRKKGVRPSDRVLVFVPMSIHLYVLVLALFQVGAVAVFLDEWVSKERMEVCCKLAGCKGFIASFKIRVFALISSELRRIPHWFGLPNVSPSSSDSYRMRGRNNTKEIYPATSNETALITFTTGSTGTPKAANRTHGFLQAQFDALMPLTNPLEGHETGPDMPMLPIVLLLNLGRGITSVIADFKATKPQKFQPKKVWNQIQRHSVVSVTTSPFYASILAENAKANSSLKRLTLGGAAVFPNLIEDINKTLPNCETVIVYGSTEAEPISHLSGAELVEYHQKNSADKGLYVGHIDDAATVALLPFDSKVGEAFLPIDRPNTPGEIVVSGNHVLRDYLDNPEAVKENKIFVGETCWHRTGDAGWMDESGKLFLLGRCKQIINFEGKTYYPFLIEYFMQTLPNVKCGTLLLKNEKLIAVVSWQGNGVRSRMKRRGIEDTEAVELIQQHIPEAEILFMDNIPLDPRHHSKIDYEKLNQLLS